MANESEKDSKFTISKQMYHEISSLVNIRIILSNQLLFTNDLT